MTIEDFLGSYDNAPFGNDIPRYHSISYQIERGAGVVPDGLQYVIDRYPDADFKTSFIDENTVITAAYKDNFREKDIFIEGLHGGPDSFFFDWQSKLSQVEDIVFLNNGVPFSYKRLMQGITDKKVEVYFLEDDSYDQEVHQLFKPVRKNGEEYYVIVTRMPRNASDLAAIFHEPGHIIAEERHKEKYEKLREELFVDQDFLDYENFIKNRMMEIGSMDRSMQADGVRNMMAEYQKMKGYKKQQTLSVICERDAWIEAVGIINGCGFDNVLDPRSEDFKDDMYFAIKTRLTGIFNAN